MKKRLTLPVLVADHVHSLKQWASEMYEDENHDFWDLPSLIRKRMEYMRDSSALTEMLIVFENEEDIVSMVMQFFLIERGIVENRVPTTTCKMHVCELGAQDWPAELLAEEVHQEVSTVHQIWERHRGFIEHRRANLTDSDLSAIKYGITAVREEWVKYQKPGGIDRPAIFAEEGAQDAQDGDSGEQTDE